MLFGWAIFLEASSFALALALGAVFVLFSAEHIYNFITRSTTPRVEGLSSPKLAGLLAVLTPSIILFFVQFFVRILNESGNSL
ncbi:hypothetical protein N483_16445 [Pseudoalteromonas luteoviolacea NCIMB 1944]|uniref:Uncharacterized protein n=1 Tax=Pseudoalteromonas luteoviolacea (strain 2ta16) TaxID=1353533 RepID=V4JF89_PSEL2|nr:hypothetical protein PL2TA16_02886 [Pseudoalteromonas luteoviolacea 2ta16]KZN41200.1 hypothetical protein N483_16445 [Pseudoalteromonas luteoviolacea NCIMB 1944]